MSVNHGTEEKRGELVVVAVTPTLRDWLKAYARAQNRSMSGAVWNILAGVHQAEMEKTGQLKEMIG